MISFPSLTLDRIIDNTMDDRVRQMVYQNAVLETELRFTRQQLLQAQSANEYLLDLLSYRRPSHNVPRLLSDPNYAPEHHLATAPKQGTCDLLSLDDAFDSGHHESLVEWECRLSTPKTAEASFSNATRGLQPRNKSVEADITNQTAHNAVNDIAPGDSTPCPTAARRLDLRGLRMKPAKNSFGIGVSNVSRSRDGLERLPESDGRLGRSGRRWGLTTNGAVDTTKQIRAVEPSQMKSAGRKESVGHSLTSVDLNGQDSFLEPFPDFHQQANLSKTLHEDGLLFNRSQDWADALVSAATVKIEDQEQANLLTRSAHGLPHSYQEKPPRPPPSAPAAFHRLPTKMTLTTYGPQSPEDLFSDPRNNTHHALYRSVTMTFVPLDADFRDAVETTDGVIAIKIIETAGMQTHPPMDTNVVKIDFESNVAAIKFMEWCSTKPFLFDPQVDLARTGTSGVIWRRQNASFATQGQ